MPVRNIKITIAYDGTDFVGWQVQKNGRTVQGEIETALARMHEHPVRIQGAGRTDSGVHATGQVANFETDLDSISTAKYREALNSYLPPDIRVVHSREVPETFNAKSSARYRLYAYYLYTAVVGYPHLRRSCWKLRREPGVNTLNRMAAQLIGEQDFTTFCAAGDSSISKIRKVVSAGFNPQGPYLVFRIGASSFLWKMVRSVLGTMIEMERDGSGAEAFAGLIQSRDRSRVGATAPARGLFLERVVYDGESFPF